MLKKYLEASAKLRKEFKRHPAKALAFFIRAGIAEVDPKFPGKIRLVKELR